MNIYQGPSIMTALDHGAAALGELHKGEEVRP